MAIKRERINASDKFRAKFLVWLGNKKGATGLNHFVQEKVMKINALKS